MHARIRLYAVVLLNRGVYSVNIMQTCTSERMAEALKLICRVTHCTAYGLQLCCHKEGRRTTQ